MLDTACRRLRIGVDRTCTALPTRLVTWHVYFEVLFQGDDRMLIYVHIH